MNTYDEFHKYLEDNQEAFASWGKYVSEVISAEISKNVADTSIESFLKIPVKPRVKEIKSALGKVARKGYTDPVMQMTDLVGTRFVVLLSQDIELVSNIIEKSTLFTAVVSKDYQEEIDLNPKLFDYQSKHFEVRPLADTDIYGTRIAKEICCEVQVRTLLQHAYAELVHDNIYKPVGIVPKAAERHIARSMALMETTDELFCSTMRLLYETNLLRNEFNIALASIYKEIVGSGHMHADEATNFLILDTYKDFFTQSTEFYVREMITSKKFLPPRIKQRAITKTLYAQPTILFIYYLIKNIPTETILDLWPLPGYLKELEMAFSDLGISTRR